MEIREMIAKMSLLEKIQLCAGINFWETKAYEEYGIPSFFMCDGPTGLRKQEMENASDILGIYNSRKATCFPSAVTVANTWDKSLAYKMGKAIGEEARDQKVSVVLGPGANIKRNPLCGRNFEYYSEDPVQAGNMAANFIKGLQSQKVGCSLKHFACNSQEKDRLSSDSVLDERTLREIYLKAFEIAVRNGGPETVMSAYNKINGIHCSDNKKLLTDILRDEWGFDGIVMTDWGGMNDRIEAFKAGNDLMMPGGSDYMEKDVMRAVEEGKLEEEDIDKCCERIISLALKVAEVLKEEYKADYHSHHEAAVKIAEDGAVLLKNEDKVLPLKEDERILVVGSMAAKARYQGAGSSHINPVELEQPLDHFRQFDYLTGCDEEGETNETLLNEIKDKAKEADKVVIFAGLPDRYESEGYDRTNMKMPEGHVKMIETAAEVNPNTVVVLMCGSAVECDWADKVKAVLYLGLSGEGVGRVVYDLLFGKANPSGKLSESWPYHYEDVVSSDIYGKTRDGLYMEGIYVGYRYYDKAKVKVRWPFGYGLSYTSFKLEDLKVEGNKVTVTVHNTGDVKGSEVVELYVWPKDSKLYRPLRELKHFEKVELKPDEKKEVKFELTDEDFMVWDDHFRKIKGEYEIEVTDGTADNSLKKQISVDGEEANIPSRQKDSWYDNPVGKPNQKEWEEMIGRKYEARKLIKGKFTMENTVEEMKDHSFIMKIMYKEVEKTIAKPFGGVADYNNPEFVMMMASSAGSPIRSMHISGGMKGGLMKGMVEMANGHYLKGILTMIKG
ncbi:MAG: glycoside hydrolase family 3 protein [Erysipelotrichaceae bacterium]|nr:glycoside hydrolase family 3 protein [Erysipelotrichaceae bacterium]